MHHRCFFPPEPLEALFELETLTWLDFPPPPWNDNDGVPSEAYIRCWSRGDVCIVAKACGAAGPLGKNPVAGLPVKTEGMIDYIYVGV
jgi:hypothetical protein